MLMWNSVLQLFSVTELLIVNGIAFSTKKLGMGFVDIFQTSATVYVACSTLVGGYCSAYVRTETVLVLKQCNACARAVV